MWRRKTYYQPRVLIDADSVLSASDADAIVCLSLAQLEMLRNVVQYLHRRSAFVSEYHNDYYVVPGNDDWNSIQAVVADLEEKLMSGTCEELISVLEGLASCVCQHTQWAMRDSARLPDMGGYVDNGDVTYLGEQETVPGAVPDPNDLVKCQYAQACYYAIYDMYTEHILPSASGTADQIVSAIVGSFGFIALVAWLGLPIAIVAALVLLIVSWGVAGSVENFVNWMLAARDELICAVYSGLPNVQLAAQMVTQVIYNASELSSLDKQVLAALYGSEWVLSWIMADQYANGTWDSYMIPGQCNDCDNPGTQCLTTVPCNESDWVSFTLDPVCAGGYPQCYPSIGYIRHVGGTLIAPRAVGNNLSVRVFAFGGPGDISVQVKVCNNATPPMLETVIEADVPTGKTAWLEGAFDTDSPGEIHYIQVANSPYYVYVLAYCID